MRACIVVLSGLLAVAAPALAAASPEELGDPDFFSTCRDGQAPTDGTLRCDADGSVDGVCTFGERDGRNIRVPVGESRKFTNSCHAVGQFSCDPPSAGTPKIVYPSDPKKPSYPSKKDPVGEKDKAAGFGKCARDSDCVPTKENGCLPRNMMKKFHDPWNRKVTCKCLKGPVFFGCVPRGSEWDRMGSKGNR